MTREGRGGGRGKERGKGREERNFVQL